jgi:L-fuculose-phosphate aldolase
MSLLTQYTHQVEQFVAVCHRLADHLYVTSAGGNLAWKLEPNLLLITPTQLNKGFVTPDDVVFIDLNGKTVEGKRRPTGETPMYLKFFHTRPDIVSVIHCHAPHVGALAISKAKNWLMRPLYPETTTEVGPVPVVPYAEPLTEKLAQAFEPFLLKYNSFIMENHGLVTLTRGGIWDTLMTVELLEGTAQSLLLAMSVGDVKEISRQDVADLDNVMRTRSIPYVGLPGVNASLEALYFEG